MIASSRIRAILSNEVIEILSDIWIKKKLEKAHELRARAGLKQGSDPYVIQLSLDMYINYWTRILRNREKRKYKGKNE